MPEDIFVMNIPRNQEAHPQGARTATALEAEYQRQKEGELREFVKARLAGCSPANSPDADLEARMKRHLDAALNEQPLSPLRDPTQTDCGKLEATQEQALDPQPGPAPSGGRQITPETAPVGARILIKDDDSCYAHLYEVTVLEWSPSGSFINVQNWQGVARWRECLPKYGVLLETLSSLPPAAPPKPPLSLAYRARHRIVPHLPAERGPRPSGCGDRDDPIDLEALLRDKPGAVAAIKNLDEEATACEKE